MLGCLISESARVCTILEVVYQTTRRCEKMNLTAHYIKLHLCIYTNAYFCGVQRVTSGTGSVFGIKADV